MTGIGGGPCDIPGVDRVCGAVGGVLDNVPNPVAAVTGYVAGQAETSFTHWLADGAASILGDVLHEADVSLRPDLGPRSFFAGRFRQVAALGGGVAVLFLLLAVGQALMRGDPAVVVSAVLVRLPVAFGVSAALLFLTSSAVAAVDQATAYVTGGDIERSAAQFTGNLSNAFLSPDFDGVGLALIALCALGTILVGILLYCELVVRTAVIYLALLFMPLGLAASVWRGAGRVARRLADILVTAVLAKFAILVTLWFAAGLLAQASSTGAAAGFGTFLTGLVALLLAAASPLVLLGFVAHAEHAVASVGQARHAAYDPPRRGAALAYMGARMAMAGAGAGAAGPGVLVVDGGGRPATRPLAGRTGGAAPQSTTRRGGDAPATPVVDATRDQGEPPGGREA